MQVRNNYDKEVFNGDIGNITDIDLEDRSLTIDFDGRQIQYDITELDEIVHAYATTIHKAQGSEYPIVVMPILMNHYVMLQRNLIYTGITRAKKILVMVGTKRNTLLKERLAGDNNTMKEEHKVTSYLDIMGSKRIDQNEETNLLVAEESYYDIGEQS